MLKEIEEISENSQQAAMDLIQSLDVSANGQEQTLKGVTYGTEIFLTLRAILLQKQAVV